MDPNRITDDLKKKREAILKAKKILEPFGDHIIVLEGASAASYSHKGIIKDLRDMLIKYEIEIGQDPYHYWSKGND